jgi:hypothetical protein
LSWLVEYPFEFERDGFELSPQALIILFRDSRQYSIGGGLLVVHSDGLYLCWNPLYPKPTERKRIEAQCSTLGVGRSSVCASSYIAHQPETAGITVQGH